MALVSEQALREATTWLEDLRRATKAGQHREWTIEKFNDICSRLQLFHSQTDTILRYMQPSSTGMVSKKFHKAAIRTIIDRLVATRVKWEERTERDIEEVAAEEEWSQDTDVWEDAYNDCETDLQEVINWLLEMEKDLAS